MKNRLHRILCLLLCLALIAGLTAGCALSSPVPEEDAAETVQDASILGDSETAAPESESLVSVSDMADRDVRLDAYASRIVVLDAADCEILCAIGAADAIVGRGEYCDYPSTIVSVPAVQSGSETNVEQIIALTPEVVVMTKMAQDTDQVDALEQAGIQVVVTDAQEISDVYTAITLLGAVTGKADEANALVASMVTAFATIQQKATEDGTKTVYFEVSPLEYGLWTAGSGTFMNELALMLGLRNEFEDLQGWAEVSQEQIIGRSPDYIVTVTSDGGDGSSSVSEIVSREGWDTIDAVKNNCVFYIDSNILSRPGPRLVDAANALYDAIYGQSAQ